MDNYMLIVIIALLIIGILLLFVKVGQYKSQSKKDRKRYTDFVGKVNEEKAVKKEIATRRRITPKMKQNILERDEYTCQICGISQGFMDDMLPGLGDYLLLEIDHIESVAKGGTGKDEDNLQVLCWRCNRKKGGNKTNEEVKEIIDYGMDYFEI